MVVGASFTAPNSLLFLRMAFFKTTVVLHKCMRVGFIQGVPVWGKGMVSVIN